MNSGTYTDKSCYLYTTGMKREAKGGERGDPEWEKKGYEGEGRVRWKIGRGDKVSLGRSITLKGKV